MSEKPTIKQLMAAAKVTEEEVAERLKITQATVSRNLNPKANPRLNTIKRMSKAMGVRWQDLAETYEDPEGDREGNDEN